MIFQNLLCEEILRGRLDYTWRGKRPPLYAKFEGVI